MFVGLLDVEEAGGEDETLEGDGGGVASVGGAVDEAGMVEDEGVGFGREGEGPYDVGGELVGGEGGVGLLPGDGGVGRDEEGLAVDGDGEHVFFGGDRYYRGDRCYRGGVVSRGLGRRRRGRWGRAGRPLLC